MIFLVGYMGSGKTTMGRKLARALGLDFVDLDEVIVSRAGRSIPEIFEAEGEAGFRALEAEVLRSLGSAGEGAPVPAVVSVGGGTPCFHDNMAWMNAHGRTIYLRLSPAALWRRLEQSDVQKRPVLQGLRGDALREFIEEKLAEREPYYLQAQYTIDQLRDKVPAVIEKCGLENV